ESFAKSVIAAFLFAGLYSQAIDAMYAFMKLTIVVGCAFAQVLVVISPKKAWPLKFGRSGAYTSCFSPWATSKSLTGGSSGTHWIAWLLNAARRTGAVSFTSVSLYAVGRTLPWDAPSTIIAR